MVDAQPPGADRILGEVEREAVGVEEFERRLAGKHVAGFQVCCRLFEQRRAAAECAAEALLLLPECILDQRLGAGELGIGGPHLLDQHRVQPVHQRLLGAQDVGVAHGAAHDAAEHVAAALVRGRDAVGDQEAGRPQVVGDDLVREAVLAFRRAAGELDAGSDQRLKEIDVVVGVDALKDCGGALEPHASVDLRPRQVLLGAVGEALPLHEDEVPDLDEAVAILVGAAGRAAGHVGAMVVEDLAVGADRAGVAHRPEVLLQAHDAALGDAGDLLPEVGGILVLRMDGNDQPVLGKGQVLADELPGELDRAGLEVVAEREVPHHLEEGVVACGVADVVEVVVLAAGAHALLRRGRAWARAPARRR